MFTGIPWAAIAGFSLRRRDRTIDIDRLTERVCVDAAKRY